MDSLTRETPDLERIEINDLESILELPENLRTQHFYNDVQHSMLVILFRYTLKSLRSHKSKFIDLLMDNITIYLYIHFLAEEEAMTYSISKEIYGRDEVCEHMNMHLSFLDYWVDEIFIPHKQNEISDAERYRLLSDFYGRIIGHIDGIDQASYGVKQEHADKNLRSEAAWVAASHIPLSPHNKGAFEVLHLLNKKAGDQVDTDKLSTLATQPLPEITMVSLNEPLLSGPRKCLRDQFYDKVTNKPGGVNVMKWLAA